MPVMSCHKLSPEEEAYCHKTISSDALAALILSAMFQHKSTSVVRFADGELAIIKVGTLGKSADGWSQSVVNNTEWCAKYGMTGANIKELKDDLLRAAAQATFVAPSISGLYMPGYNLYPYMKDRQYFVDTFYMYYWKAADRLESILTSATKIHIINRDWERLAKGLTAKFKLKCAITGFAINNWKDRPAAKESAITSKANLVLVSGGPPGKVLTVDIANETGRIALDVGCGIETWL